MLSHSVHNLTINEQNIFVTDRQKNPNQGRGQILLHRNCMYYQQWRSAYLSRSSIWPPSLIIGRPRQDPDGTRPVPNFFFKYLTRPAPKIDLVSLGRAQKALTWTEHFFKIKSFFFSITFFERAGKPKKNDGKNNYLFWKDSRWSFSVSWFTHALSIWLLHIRQLWLSLNANSWF